MLFDTTFIKKHGLFAAGLLFFLLIFVKNAWVADDAYISFRSVEQVFAGHGPRWNSDERVQVYTSPLWFGLLLIGRVFSSNLFLVSISLSACCCVGALLIVRKMIGNDKHWLLFVLLLSGVWSVMDFSSSGLENPLLYFLLTAFFYTYFAFFTATEAQGRRNYVSYLLLILGLLSIARHDVSTLVLIPVLYLLFTFCRNTGWKQGGLFVLQKSYLLYVPLLAWTIFSVIYYGVPFPNTAYAKMLHGVARADLIDFGLLYIKVSLIFDGFALLVLSALLLRVVWKRELPLVFLVSGVLLNFCYVVYVGGDFMQGRFISEAMFVAVLGLVAPGTISIGQQPTRMHTFVPALIAALVVLMLLVESPLKLRPDSGFDLNEGHRHYSWRGILNERNFYFKTNSLWAYYQYKKEHRDIAQPFPDHKWCKMGINTREQNKQSSDFGGIGMYGYCAGLDLIVIDNLALAEPFLARLPKAPDHDWRAGHFHRDYPQGYYESRLSGENHLLEPHLAALWDDVFQLTRAPLFTRGRWASIWRINTGYYKDIGSYYFADIAEKGG